MKNYINADLYRIFRRVPRWIKLGMVMVIIGVIFWPNNDSEATIIDLVDLLETVLKYAPVYLGFIEIMHIFGDDFAGKTAQIAIGTGVKRAQVIMAKWLEMIIVITVDTTIIVIIALSLSVIHTHSLPGQLVVDIIAHIIVSVLAAGAFTALVFPLMFAMQNITLAFLIYILLSAGAINKLISLLANAKLLRKLMIEQFTLTNCLNVFRSRMILGSFKVESLLGIIIYIGLALAITCFIYKKRELEF